MTYSAKNPDFMHLALVALTKLTGEFTVRDMAERLRALGVPEPQTVQPLRSWGVVAAEGVKRGLLLKTTKSVMARTDRMNGSTERLYFYARTERMDPRMPPSRFADAVKLLAERQAQMAPP